MYATKRYATFKEKGVNMGYQTGYTLTSDPEIFHEILVDQLNTITDYDFEVYCNNDLGLDAKWYKHEEDMKELTQLYPEVLFTLHGEGEDDEDKWYKYFKNGKMQECYATISIVYPEYNEKEMK